MVSQVSRVLVYNLTPPAGAGRLGGSGRGAAHRALIGVAHRRHRRARRSDWSQPTAAAIIVIVLDEPRVCVFVCVHVCVRARLHAFVRACACLRDTSVTLRVCVRVRVRVRVRLSVCARACVCVFTFCGRARAGGAVRRSERTCSSRQVYPSKEPAWTASRQERAALRCSCVGSARAVSIVFPPQEWFKGFIGSFNDALHDVSASHAVRDAMPM